MYKFLKYLVVALIILYPVFIFLGLNYLSPAQLGLALLCLFMVRMIFIRRDRLVQTWPLVVAALLGAGLAGTSWLLDTTDYLLWYPVVVNAVFFCSFTLSIIYPPTVIETFARLREKNLSREAVCYTRKVTMAWSVFFVLNALAATWTVVHGDLAIWTLYNGFIAYILIGLFFVAEFIVRQNLRNRQQIHGDDQ